MMRARARERPDSSVNRPASASAQAAARRVERAKTLAGDLSRCLEEVLEADFRTPGDGAHGAPPRRRDGRVGAGHGPGYRGDVVVKLPPGVAPAGLIVVAKPEVIDLVRYLRSLDHTYPVLPAQPRGDSTEPAS